jgi:hypothetical protein
VLRTLLFTAAVLVLGSGYAKAGFVIDQQNTSHNDGGSADYAIGQSFTPTATSMNTVEFLLYSNSTTILQLAILDGVSGSNGLDGTVLATSAEYTLTSSSVTAEWVAFQLPSPLTVTPGQTYVAELIYDGGAYFDWYQDDGNPYPGGQEFQSAYPADFLASGDLAYQEGLTTDVSAAPEPGSLTLLGLGVAGMAGYGWRRRN